MDNMLSSSQTDIGESSNLAQIAQSYACNFDDPKYQDYVCILSVVAQAAIDSAKRRFDIDISSEIKRIKKDMDILPAKRKGKIIKEGHLYPVFWKCIKKDFNKELINYNLHCPMNYLYNLKFERNLYDREVIPISYFFKKFPRDINKKTCRRVEEMITRYSLKLHDENVIEFEDDANLLLRSDFEDLVKTISTMNISGSYISLFSWLIDRSFKITVALSQRNINTTKSTMYKNRSLLLKVLYNVNKSNLLKCFSNNI